jgi:hypothetical protein
LTHCFSTVLFSQKNQQLFSKSDPKQAYAHGVSSKFENIQFLKMRILENAKILKHSSKTQQITASCNI